MADKPTKVKLYSFGDRKLDYGKYIANLKNNVESYLQNQRDVEGWDDNRINEFRNAFNTIYTNFEGDYNGEGTRFSTNLMGAIMDNLGTLNDTDADNFYYNKKGEKLTSDELSKLSPRKQRKYEDFKANREVAEYFRLIGSYMKNYEDTTEKFDISKHGFNAWLMNKEAPGGTFNYQNYWDLDPVDEKTGKRGTIKREEMAAKWMEDYLTEMKDKNLSFEGNKTFSSMDDYIKRGNDVLAEWLKAGWSALDRIGALRFGVDNDFVTKFFGVEGNPELTAEQNAEIKAQKEELAKLDAEQKTAEDLNKQYLDWVEEQGTAYHRSGYRSTPLKLKIPDIHKYYDFDNGSLFKSPDGTTKTDYDTLLESFNGDLDSNVVNYLSKLYDPNPNISGSLSVRNHYIYLPWALYKYGERLEDGRYYIHIPDDLRNTRNYTRNSALIFNPRNDSFEYTFIGDVPGLAEWKKRTDAYKQGLQQKQTGYKYSNYALKEGGILKYLNGRDISYAEYKRQRDKERTEALKKKAETKGRTVERLQAAERKAHAPFAGHQPDNEWSSVEIARFSGAIADITAALASFVPVYGTAASGIAGAGSSLANLYADIADDSVSGWEALKNLGLNAGMDILGLIPGGGAASKFTKIARNIGRYGSRLAAALGTMGAVQNKDAIIASFKKMTDDPANMTVEDWQNVSQGIGIATGLTAGGMRNVQRKAKGSPDALTDFAAVRLQSKANPNKTVNHIVGKKTAADLRAASNAKEMQEILYRDNPWLKDNFVIKEDKGIYGRPIKPSLKNKSLFGEATPQIYEVRRDKDGNLFGYNSSKWGGDLALYDNGRGGQSFKRRTKKYTTSGTMLPGERQSRVRDYEKVRDYVGSPYNKDGMRHSASDDDFQEAFYQSKNDLDDVSNKSWLLETERSKKQLEIDALKPFRDKNGSTSDITKLLNNSKTLKNSADYQTAVGQHAALTQSHNDLVARHQPIIDSNKQQIQDIDRRLVELNNKRSSTSKDVRDAANKEIRSLNRIRQRLQTDIDNRAAEIVASENKVKANKAKIDEGSDARIAELENLERRSKEFDKKLTDFDAEISRLEQLGGKHTPTYKKLLEKRAKDGKITFTDEYGKSFLVDAVRAMSIAGIRKNGGTLDMIPKYLGGTPDGGIKPKRNVTNTGNVTWFGDMYSNDASRLKEYILNSAKGGQESVDAFNNLQSSWRNNLNETGYQQGQADAPYLEAVYQRLGIWDKATNTNLYIEKLATEKGEDGKTRLTRAGESGDNSERDFRDGYFGELEYLRHAGSAESWEGQDDALKAFLDEVLKASGGKYEYRMDDNDHMFKLLPVDQSKEGKPEVKDGKNPSTLSPRYEKEKDKKVLSLYDKGKQLFGDPSELMSLARLNNTLGEINKVRELDKKKLPYLKLVATPHLYVRKDFMALQNARKAQLDLMHLATASPTTADGNTWAANFTDRIVNMLDIGLKGNQAADTKFWETSDASKANEIANQKALTDNANENMASLIEKQHNDITSEEVAEYKKNEAINTWLYENQTRRELEQKEKKAALRLADALYLDNEINYNLKKYAKDYGISDAELAVWDKVQSGTLPSDLSKDEHKLWESVYRKANYAKGMLSAKQSGANISGFNNVRDLAKKSPKAGTEFDSNAPSWIQLSKEGSKIAAKSRIKVAKIRERVKNADRAARAVEKNLDRVLRTVESINKRMYGIKR